MKDNQKFLVPFAVLVLLVACVTSMFGFLVVVLTALGYGEWIPVLYYWQFNVPLISVVAPIIGMIIIAAILLGISGANRGIGANGP